MGSHRPVLYGGLISTATPEEHERLFGDVFGMAVVGTTRLDAAAASALFAAPTERCRARGAADARASSPGWSWSSFAPTSAETVRTYDTRVDRDALKVIDFYAPDYEAAIAHARGLGYEVVEAEAEYELAAGTFREAHLWAPDNVVTAFLGGPAGVLRRLRPGRRPASPARCRASPRR